MYKDEGEFTADETIHFKTELTGVFPFELVMSDNIRQKLSDLPVVPISEYEVALSLGDDWNVDDVLLVWFVPRSIKKKKTARGAEYWILSVIDETNAMTTIRCWGPRPEKDVLYVNRPYMARIDHSKQWGFSTRSISRNFRLLG